MPSFLLQRPQDRVEGRKFSLKCTTNDGINHHCEADEVASSFTSSHSGSIHWFSVTTIMGSSHLWPITIAQDCWSHSIVLDFASRKLWWLALQMVVSWSFVPFCAVDSEDTMASVLKHQDVGAGRVSASSQSYHFCYALSYSERYDHSALNRYVLVWLVINKIVCAHRY